MLSPHDATPERAAGWRRGSVGSARVWDDTMRAARRSGRVPGPPPVAVASRPVPPAETPSLDRLQRIVVGLFERTIATHFPDLGAGERERITTELRGLLGEILDGRAQLPNTAPAERAPEGPGRPLPVPREDVAPELAERLRAGFDRLGEGIEGMEAVRETALTMILDAVDAARRRAVAGAVVVEGTPEDLARIDLLERRASKLTRSLAATREALQRVALLDDFDPGIPSIYRAVQGLTQVDALYRVKRELLADIFEANVRLQEELRNLHPRRSRVA